MPPLRHIYYRTCFLERAGNVSVDLLRFADVTMPSLVPHRDSMGAVGTLHSLGFGIWYGQCANMRICECESVLFRCLLAGRSLLRSHTGGGVSVVRISAPEVLVRTGDSVRLSPSISQPPDSSHVIPMSVEEFIDMRYMSLRRMMDGPGL